MRPLNLVARTASHGSITCGARIGAFGLGIVGHRPGLRIERHTHVDPKITVVLHGGFRESLRGRDLVCETGTLFFKPAGEPHTNSYGPDGARSLIIDAPRLDDPRLRLTESLYERFYFSPGGIASRLALRIAHEMQHLDDSAALAIEGLLLELLASARRDEEARTREADRHWLRRSVDYIHANRSKRVSIAVLAGIAGATPVRLAREFRRRYGQTPGAFQRRIRAEWAAEELVRTDRPIAEIAVDAGFTDQSHFTRVFSRLFGQTPASYRNRTSAT